VLNPRVQAVIGSLYQSKARLARARDPRPDAAVADARRLHLDAADLGEQRLAADPVALLSDRRPAGADRRTGTTCSGAFQGRGRRCGLMGVRWPRRRWSARRSSGKVSRHRLNPGGDRNANHALWRIVITRMSAHPATRAYVDRRSQEGLPKKEIIRC
jgi:hypothetical protein